MQKLQESQLSHVEPIPQRLKWAPSRAAKKLRQIALDASARLGAKLEEAVLRLAQLRAQLLLQGFLCLSTIAF